MRSEEMKKNTYKTLKLLTHSKEFAIVNRLGPDDNIELLENKVPKLSAAVRYAKLCFRFLI